MVWLRRLEPADLNQVTAVYRDAVISQAQGLYSEVQITAWANHSSTDEGVRRSICRGHGLVSCSSDDFQRIEAFALLEPVDRLALLYCRGRACRQGRATALVTALEDHARGEGCRQLRTEASQVSRPLLERLGWQIEAEEEVIFAGEAFRRWRMIRALI
jgi:GNAT superfamily N-acetyltransferase